MPSEAVKPYTLAALIIHATKQDVTEERIKSIFSTLNIEYSKKMASFFVKSSEEYSNMISSANAAPIAVSSSVANAAPAQKNKAEEETAESSSEELAFDF